MSGDLLHAWEASLRRRGRERAVVQAIDGNVCSFQELDTRAQAWLATPAVSRLPHLRGRAVVFATANGIGWLEIFLGLLRAGAVAVPLDASEPPAAQRRLAEELRAGAWWDGRQLVTFPRPRVFRDPAVTLIKLTSGTTGEPRPLIFTGAQLIADARHVTASMGIGAKDLNYALIPLGHSYGLGNLTVPLIARGIPLVCGSAPLPHAIAADFARWRPTVFPGVPAIFRALNSSGLEAKALESLRLAISAGAPLARETALEFAAHFGRRLHSFYGTSETGGIAFDRTGSHTLAGGVGTPLRGVDVTALRGQRIRVSSAAVCTHGNRGRVGRHGSWIPPDRAEFDSRRRLLLLGRRGTTVKIAGRRVNLAEVTARLRRLPEVRDAWVAVGPGSDPMLGAVLATRRAPAEIRAELLVDTAAWKIPKQWATVEEFPLTARGKPDPHALRARLGW